jgi:NDP-sugar pyrophosphorylase family protein
MKAILLAGGRGTRLRPLTVNTPKPIVPIFNRPFLYYQLDLLKQVPEIDEAILSLNYQPTRIEDVFGDGSTLGINLRYVVEPIPLGTAGAVKYAGNKLNDTVVVFNGDILTSIDLAAVIRLHRERQARATIVLTPVSNPEAYGLVETDALGNVTRFREKPDSNEALTNHINAGIYVLEPETLERIPSDVEWSIERRYFPSLVESGETFVAYQYDGYWIDIGTPQKYVQVHQDIFDDRYAAGPFLGLEQPHRAIASNAKIDDSAIIEGPCFIDEDVVIRAGAHVGPYSVIGRQCVIEEEAKIEASIVWPNCRISKAAALHEAILGRNCRIGRSVTVRSGAVLGDKTILTDYSYT